MVAGGGGYSINGCVSHAFTVNQKRKVTKESFCESLGLTVFQLEIVVISQCKARSKPNICFFVFFVDFLLVRLVGIVIPNSIL